MSKYSEKDTKAITRSVVDGTKMVLKLTKISWRTQAFFMSRSQIYENFRYKALHNNCVYMLLGNDGIIEKVYVGKTGKKNDGKSAIDRLKQHDIDETEKYHGIWKYALVFTGTDNNWDDLNINVIEYMLHEIIDKRYILNGITPNMGSTSEDMQSVYNDFIDNIINLTKAAGFGIFNTIDTKETVEISTIIENNKLVEDLSEDGSKIPEIITPHWIVNGMVKGLEEPIFNDKTRFIDIACKGGEFLRAVYDRLMNSELMKELYENDYTRHTHIMDKQLFGVALSEVSMERTKRNLLDSCKNIIMIDDYINIIKGRTNVNLEKTLMNQFNIERGDRDMVFDIVIGNPPYQENNGGGNGASAISIYPSFIDAGLKISNKLCMIIPSRWMSDSPNGYNDESLLELRTRDDIHQIIDFGSKQIFNGVNIAGGVCIIYIDSKIRGKRHDTHGFIIRDEIYRGIIQKVVSNNFTSLSEIMTSDCFRSGKHMNSGWEGHSDIQDEHYKIKYYCSDKDSLMGYGYVMQEDIIKNFNVVNEYKLAIQSSSPVNGYVINKPFIMEPNSCCSRTYIVLHDNEIINSLDKVSNAKKYLSTKFARACIKSIKNTQNASARAYRFVPIQNFGEDSDVNWKMTLEDIDKYLYKKYNLTQDEINYIENTIKPMN